MFFPLPWQSPSCCKLWNIFFSLKPVKEVDWPLETLRSYTDYHFSFELESQRFISLKKRLFLLFVSAKTLTKLTHCRYNSTLHKCETFRPLSKRRESSKTVKCLLLEICDDVVKSCEMFGLFFYDDFKDLKRTLPFGKALVKIRAEKRCFEVSGLIMSLDKDKFVKLWWKSANIWR